MMDSNDIEVFADFIQFLNSIGQIDLLLKVGDVNVAANKWKKGELSVYTDGTQVWRNAYGLHRDDGPAITWSDGSQRWYQNGKYHRNDGPAIIFANGTQLWYQNGKRIEQP